MLVSSDANCGVVISHSSLSIAIFIGPSYRSILVNNDGICSPVRIAINGNATIIRSSKIEIRGIGSIRTVEPADSSWPLTVSKDVVVACRGDWYGAEACERYGVGFSRPVRLRPIYINEAWTHLAIQNGLNHIRRSTVK